MNLRSKTSIMVVRFVVDTDVSLEQFVFREPNCIFSVDSPWRCTFHAIDYTMNIFVAKKLSRPAFVCMAFSQTRGIGDFDTEFLRLFGHRPRGATLVNWVVKFYTDLEHLNLESLFDALNASNGNTRCFFVRKIIAGPRDARRRIHSYDEADSDDSDLAPRRRPRELNLEASPLVNMDQQSFSALMLKPYPMSASVVMEIFSSGIINVAGMSSTSEFDRVREYIEDKLVPQFILATSF